MSTSSSGPESAEESVLRVVSTDIDEVEVTVGPRRIHGLVMATAELEDEARAARVYGKHGAGK